MKQLKLTNEQLQQAVEWLSEAIKSLEVNARCITCSGRLRPSAICCINGHTVCVKCRPKLTKCPTCSAAFSLEERSTLHKILEVLPYNCTFSECTEITTDIDDHEKWCSFRPTGCLSCDWNGPASDIRDHVQTTHFKQYSASEFIITSTLRDEKQLRMRIHFDQCFWEKTVHSFKENKIYVQCIWVPNGKVKHDIFQLVVLLESDTCRCDLSTRIMFNPEDGQWSGHFILHRDLYSRFVKNTVITYKVYISKELVK